MFISQSRLLQLTAFFTFVIFILSTHIVLARDVRLGVHLDPEMEIKWTRNDAFQAGDFILSLDNKLTRNWQELANALEKVERREEMEIRVLRDGYETTLYVHSFSGFNPELKSPDELCLMTGIFPFDLKETTPTVKGVEVGAVIPGSPASVNEIKHKDVILAWALVEYDWEPPDWNNLHSVRGFYEMEAELESDDRLRLRILRDGHVITEELDFIQEKQLKLRDISWCGDGECFLGVGTKHEPARPEFLRNSELLSGIEIANNKRAQDSLEKGDVIIGCNFYYTPTNEDLQAVVKRFKPGDEVQVIVLKQDRGKASFETITTRLLSTPAGLKCF